MFLTRRVLSTVVLLGFAMALVGCSDTSSTPNSTKPAAGSNQPNSGNGNQQQSPPSGGSGKR